MYIATRVIAVRDHVINSGKFGMRNIQGRVRNNLCRAFIA